MHPATPPPLTIRPAVGADAASLARLLTVLGHPTNAHDLAQRWPDWLAAGNVALVAAAADGTLVGAATLGRMFVLHRPRPVGRITALVVEPTWRGQGIGRALVQAAERQLADAGCGLLEVTSNERLEAAHAFYQRLGYGRTSLRFAKELLPPAE